MINLFPHILGIKLVLIQMYHQLFFHTFGEEPLAQGLQCPNDRILQGYLWVAFTLLLLSREVEYQLRAVGSIPGVLWYQLLVVLAELGLLGGM